MAQTIRLKRSSTTGSVPAAGSLEFGEVAINTTDGRMFTKMNDTTGANSVQTHVMEFAVLNNGVDQDFTSNVIMSGTGYLKIPVGTTAQRPATMPQGSIRYNTTLNTFEGYTGSSWGSLGGVIDTPQTTYALAGVSGNTSLPDTGTANTLTFVTASTTAGTWDTTNGLDVNTKLNVDGNFTTTANSTLGNAAADTLTVNATSTFVAPASFNGNTTIGDAAADTMTVNATATFVNDANFNGNMTLGNAAGDAITVTGTATFAEKATFNKGISIPAGFGITLNGTEYKYANKFTILNSAGSVVFGGWVLDTDTNTAN